MKDSQVQEDNSSRYHGLLTVRNCTVLINKTSVLDDLSFSPRTRQIMAVQISQQFFGIELVD